MSTTASSPAAPPNSLPITRRSSTRATHSPTWGQSVGSSASKSLATVRTGPFAYLRQHTLILCLTALPSPTQNLFVHLWSQESFIPRTTPPLPLHQQKKTCLQLPYNALLCLTEPVRHNKAL